MTTNQPPTEQDKELEKLIRNNIHTFADEYLELGECVAALTDYITADRKRVALEARIDELEKLQKLSTYTENVHRKLDRTVSTRLNHLAAELKAQQEENL